MMIARYDSKWCMLSLCLLLGILPCVAESGPKPAPKTDLTNWWQKSSYDFSPEVHRFLAHVDGVVSYTDAQGNTTGSTFNGKLDLSLRKDRLTARSTGWIQKQNIVYGFNAGSAHVTQDTLREQFNYDLNKRSSLIMGIEEYTYTLIFMDSRFTEYGGYGIGLIKGEKQKLNVVGALGYTEFNFNRTGMLAIPNPYVHQAVLALPTTSPSGAGGTGMAAYRLSLPHRISLNENLSYMKFFDSYLGHQTISNTNVDISLSRHLGLQPGYQLIEQDNQIIDALQVKTMDRLLMLGLRMSW